MRSEVPIGNLVQASGLPQKKEQTFLETSTEIKRLIYAGVDELDIFKQMGLDPNVYDASIRRLHVTGKLPDGFDTRPVTKKLFEQEVAELRNQRLSGQQITDAINSTRDVPVSKSLIERTIQRLSADNRVERMRKPPTKIADKEAFYQRIIELRRTNTPIREIANLLNVSQSQVNQAVSELIKRDEIPRLPAGRRPKDKPIVLFEAKKRGRKPTQIDEEGSTPESLLIKILLQCEQEEPGLPVKYSLSELGMLSGGITRQRVGQILDKIYASGLSDLPPRPAKHVKATTARRDTEILRMLQNGASLKEICDKYSIMPHTFYNTKKRLIDRGLLPKAPKNPEQKLKEDQIFELRKRMVNTQEIAALVGMSVTAVQEVIKKGVRNGTLERVRRKRRSKKEMEEFNQQVKALRLQNPFITYKEMAELLGSTQPLINSAISELIKRGELPRIWDVRTMKTPPSGQQSQ